LSAVDRHPASFRDPAGFIFERDGQLFRAVHPDAAADIDALFSNGLYDELVATGLLVPHRRIEDAQGLLPAGWQLLAPERLPVISYACEWTDGQLLSAALLTLELQRRALGRGLTLKDASSFNVQFVGAKPVFIDILSFTRSRGERAWVAYRQFCEHFLAPLALRRHAPGTGALGVTGLAGWPLSLASKLLPASTWLRPGLALHIHLHARSAASNDRTPTRPPVQDGSKGPGGVRPASDFLLQLANSLESAVRGLRPPSRESPWSDYRQSNTYSTQAAGEKLRFVRDAVQRSAPARALDLGANDGFYALELAAMGVACTAVEMDGACAEAVYASSLASPSARLLNTVRVDLSNPTPSHGWAHEERASFESRLRCDLTLSLALVHHLSITHQVPFEAIAAFLDRLAPQAVVEYVPIDDPMVQQLLSARAGLTDNYLETLSERAFVSSFETVFDCLARSEPLAGGRVLFHFRRKDIAPS
jgi:hypothetical protein